MTATQTASEEADALFRTHVVETNALSDAYNQSRAALIAQAKAAQAESDAKIIMLTDLHNRARAKMFDDYWESRRRLLGGG